MSEKCESWIMKMALYYLWFYCTCQVMQYSNITRKFSKDHLEMTALFYSVVLRSEDIVKYILGVLEATKTDKDLIKVIDADCNKMTALFKVKVPPGYHHAFEWYFRLVVPFQIH